MRALLIAPETSGGKTTGVRLGINPGQGAGRVVDVTLFDPTLVSQ